MFLINLPVTALLIGFGIVLLPESRDPDPGPFDLLSAASSVLAVVPIVHAVKEAAGEGVTPLALLSAVVGVTCGVLFVRRQRRLPTPLFDMTLFRLPAFSGAVVANMLSISAPPGSAAGPPACRGGGRVAVDPRPRRHRPVARGGRPERRRRVNPPRRPAPGRRGRAARRRSERTADAAETGPFIPSRSSRPSDRRPGGAGRPPAPGSAGPGSRRLPSPRREPSASDNTGPAAPPGGPVSTVVAVALVVALAVLVARRRAEHIPDRHHETG